MDNDTRILANVIALVHFVNACESYSLTDHEIIRAVIKYVVCTLKIKVGFDTESTAFEYLFGINGLIILYVLTCGGVNTALGKRRGNLFCVVLGEGYNRAECNNAYNYCKGYT